MPTHNGPESGGNGAMMERIRFLKTADQVGAAGIEINVLIISGLARLCDKCLCGNKITKRDHITYKCQRKSLDKHGKWRDPHTEDTYL